MRTSIGPISTEVSGTQADLWDITGSEDGQYLWAVGSKGTILRWDRNNPTWQPELVPTAAQTKAFYAVWVGNGEAWAAGEAGTILHRSVLAP
jgi:photosystem II stability/assembly factor-like uncharacterized protein